MTTTTWAQLVTPLLAVAAMVVTIVFAVRSARREDVKGIEKELEKKEQQLAEMRTRNNDLHTEIENLRLRIVDDVELKRRVENMIGEVNRVISKIHEVFTAKDW